MNYQFPVIEHIRQVLPHIEERSEFIVKERIFGTVVNYVVARPNSFDMDGPNDLGGAIRRELRGIIFDHHGHITSRPFQKFFNVGERLETLVSNVDLTQEHVILEKADGSMIRPMLFEGALLLGTKMGFTDVGADATKLLTPELSDWLRDLVDRGKTPLMEYVSPDNKIVVQYRESKLILLAIRDTVTGAYDSLPESCPIEIVKSHGSVSGDANKYLESIRGDEGREGIIIRFPSGHMMKSKNDWYVLLHKTKDRIRFERNICDVIINETLDDLLPILDEDDTKTVLDFQKKFDHLFMSTITRLENVICEAKTRFEGNKKRVALEMIPILRHKEDSPFIFSALDGKDLRTGLISKIKSSVTNIAKYDELMDWMNK